MRYSFLFILFALLSLGLLGCQPTATAVATQPTSLPSTETAPVTVTAVVPIATHPPKNKPNQPPATPTPLPTTSATPLPTATSTPTTTPTATPVGVCENRILSDDDLLSIVTLTYNISRDYQPGDLVPIGDYLSVDVTLGYPTEVRAIVIEPLVQMINDMQAIGLQPQIISGYRSHSAQSIAWTKWLRDEPERAHMLSAPPGHSEHQLGVTVDFGSPELPDIVGIENIQFHTYFYQTSEGQWLLENAHNYGFTLSYPREAQELTGFYYEPWHYRYVGVALATYLHENNTFLTAYQFETQPIPPCIPQEK